MGIEEDPEVEASCGSVGLHLNNDNDFIWVHLPERTILSFS